MHNTETDTEYRPSIWRSVRDGVIIGVTATLGGILLGPLLSWGGILGGGL